MAIFNLSYSYYMGIQKNLVSLGTVLTYSCKLGWYIDLEQYSPAQTKKSVIVVFLQFFLGHYHFLLPFQVFQVYYFFSRLLQFFRGSDQPELSKLYLYLLSIKFHGIRRVTGMFRTYHVTFSSQITK